CFESRWESASAYLKNRMMWRMLDDPSLAQAWHHTFREFVFNEWDTFSDFNIRFYGKSLKGLNSIISRLGDEKFPVSKKWVYICSIVEAVEDVKTAESLVKLAASIGDQFARETAEEVRRRFFASEVRCGVEPESPCSTEESLSLGF